MQHVEFRRRVEEVYEGLTGRPGDRPGSLAWFQRKSGYSYAQVRRMASGGLPVSDKAVCMLVELERRATALSALQE